MRLIIRCVKWNILEIRCFLGERINKKTIFNICTGHVTLLLFVRFYQVGFVLFRGGRCVVGVLFKLLFLVKQIAGATLRT